MAEIKFSQLTTAAQLTNDDIFALAQMQGGSLSSVKTSMIAVANFLNTQVQYTTAYNTQAKTTAGAINELKQLISLIPQFSIEVVEELPTEDISDTTIYLVPAEDPEVGNYYEEHIHVNDSWELVGTTAVDLSAYYTKLEVDAKFSALATVATSGSYNDLSNKPDLTALMDVNEATFINPYIKKIVPTGKYTEKLKKIIGATVCWNQLVRNGNFADGTNYFASTYGSISATNGVCSYTVTELRENIFANGIQPMNFTVDTNHLYFMRSDITLPHTPTGSRFNLYLGGIYKYFNPTANTKTRCQAIFKPTVINSPTIHFAPYASDGWRVGDIAKVENFMIFDLTAMFGIAIADRAYAMEQAEAGSGIVWLQSYGFFLDAYNAYDAGSLQSVSVSAKINKDSNDQIIISKALDHTDLNGLFKLDANNNLYADGDIYESDGTLTRKYKEADMGNLDWTLDNNNRFIAIISDIKNPTTADERATGIMSTLYVASNSPISQTNENMTMARYNSRIYLYNSSYSDAQTFKTAMSGVPLMYEIATPTTTTITSYTSLQNIESGGTEEFIDYGVEQGTRDVAIPAGNETAYGDNELMGKVINYIND